MDMGTMRKSLWEIWEEQLRARVAVATRLDKRRGTTVARSSGTSARQGWLWPAKKEWSIRFKSTSSTGTTYPMKENPTRILSEKVTNGRRAHSASRGRVRMDPLKKDEIVQPNMASFIHVSDLADPVPGITASNLMVRSTAVLLPLPSRAGAR